MQVQLINGLVIVVDGRTRSFAAGDVIDIPTADAQQLIARNRAYAVSGLDKPAADDADDKPKRGRKKA